MTVGVLITAAAVALLIATGRRQNPPDAAILAVTGALGLTAIT